VFGPDLVLLGPDEHFTVVVLSAGKPKREGVISSLALNLGPDFMSDVVIVETLDHARL
jgi:major vault protein